MRKYKTGVMLGKFMPPHFGHVFSVETALAHCDKVHLLVYTMKGEPLEGFSRYDALRSHFISEDRLIITWVEKNLPQEPHEDPNFWDIWKHQVESDVQEKIDCFFGSENYVKTMGEICNCDHFIVNIDRKIVPISGTSCRENTSDEWEYIIPEFRHKMVKKICFVGGESTGKSTITKAMAKVFMTNYVEEYGREHCSIKPPSEFTPGDFYAIALEQQKRVSRSAHSSYKYLFCDTDTITTQAFFQLYLKKNSIILDAYISEDDYYHYFLLAPTIEFEQDGTREFESHREEQFVLIKSLLDKWKKPYTVVTESDYLKRVQKIKFLINVLK
jgi:HTH-type transcriptional repressor of NAD biosynthesis genes